MVARSELIAVLFAGLAYAMVACAAFALPAPALALEFGSDAVGAFDLGAQSDSGTVTRTSGTFSAFSSFSSDLNQVLTRLPPDARRYLVMGALLLFIWLMVRALGRQRAARREKEERERRFKKYAGSPSYPGTDVTVGPALTPKGRQQMAQQAPRNTKARPGSIAARLAEEEAAAEAAAAEPAPAKPEPKRAATDELDFSTLHKRAVEMPHIERTAPVEESDAPPGEQFSDPFDESDLLDDDDPMLVLAGDDSTDPEGFDENDPMFDLDAAEPAAATNATDDVDLFDDDDPLFTLPGDEAEAPTEPVAPVPEKKAAPTPANAKKAGSAPAAGLKPAPAKSPAPPKADAPAKAAPSKKAAAPKMRVAALKRSDEALPSVARLEIGTGTGAPSAAEVVPRLLAKGQVRADVIQYSMDEEDVRDPAAAGRLADLVRAADQSPARLQALVDAELAEADVAIVRTFGQALAGEGMALGLEASVTRNRLPMIVTMANATRVAFTADVVDEAIASDEARAQLARVIEGVRKRGARVILRCRSADAARALQALGAQAPSWDYLEVAKTAS